MSIGEEITVVELPHSSKGIYKKRQLVLMWGRKGKRKACKHIALDGVHESNEISESLSNISSYRVSFPPVPKFWETQAPLESKSKRKAIVKPALKKRKFAKLQDAYFTFAIENARLEKDLNRYQ